MRVRLALLALVLLACSGVVTIAGSGANQQADLELVLAVDASGSVDADEFALQTRGIAKAFRSADIQQAIRAGPHARIAVAMVVWADASVPKDDTPWYFIDSPESAESFAQLIENFPRRVEGGTGIGSAVVHSIHLMQWNDIDAPRRVVDVSGDGRETAIREDNSLMMPTARAMAIANAVTVNGLAILSEEKLDDWYRENVMTGPDSFVLAANDYASFDTAIHEKLLREIESKLARGTARGHYAENVIRHPRPRAPL